MFRKTNPLQSKSEILLRNITVTGMLLTFEYLLNVLFTFADAAIDSTAPIITRIHVGSK